ncbi:helix-turn-helix transcriptional regulator [Chitinophaga sp. MM2321]|uniref:helix-turn-helix transcriptional regulator n=1 Tax=Chitinophaga sp. MM2321 TaxID=3137178 RepID=UPI0032D58220
MGDVVFNQIKVVLAEKRKANKWLAEAIGVSVNTVSKWCTNTTQPSIETLFEIAEALDVEARELLVLRRRK